MNDEKNKSELNNDILGNHIDEHHEYPPLADVDGDSPRSDNENSSDIANSICSENNNEYSPDCANNICSDNDDPFDNPNANVIEWKIWNSDYYQSIFSEVAHLKNKTRQINNDQNDLMNIQLINNEFDIYREQDKSFSSCLSLQGDLGNDDHLVQNPGKKTKKPKTKIQMNDNEEKFKYDFYGVFTRKKKFPKQLVIQIHKFITTISGLRRMTRKEMRSIDLYFVNFYHKKEEILQLLTLNKEKIQQEILTDVEKLK